VPQFTDTKEGLSEIGKIANRLKNLKKIELLPFHKMCVEKYEKLGIPFPLADTPECNKELIEALKEELH
jgi:pyruvate formate lyase activating enzyme